MKIIDITPYYHEKSGGIKTYLEYKIKYLEQKSDIEHILIIPSKENDCFVKGKTKVFTIKSPPIPLSGGYRYFINFEKIKEIIIKENPDILEIGGAYFLGALLSKLKKELNLTISTFYHSSFILDSKKISKTFFKKAFKNIDIIIVPSSHIKRELSFLLDKEIHVINLGIDKEVFNLNKDPSLERKLIGLDEKKIQILYVGRISKEKNIKKLIEVLDKLNEDRFQINIVGDGPLFTKVLKWSSKKKNVKLFGYISDKNLLSKVYRACDIFVSFSKTETFCITFLEAQSCGLPVCSVSKDLDSLIEKRFCVKKEEDAISVIEKADYKNINRKALSQKALESFSWENTFEKLISIYGKKLSEKRKNLITL